jgi:hypothetical protein
MGIKHWILPSAFVRTVAGSSDQISGYDVAKAATHCTEGKKILPMLELYQVSILAEREIL